MNLLANPTEAELAALFASCDDSAANHMLWVSKTGQVHLDPIPQELSPVGYFEKRKSEHQFRYETFGQGNGYTGMKAAADKRWIKQILTSLKRDWENGTRGYTDSF